MRNHAAEPGSHASVRITGGSEAAAPEPPRRGFARCASASGFHKVAYTDWGPPDAEHVVLCVHGLTRQGRDFDWLAARLAADGHRVICPDLVGRGRSDWLPTGLDYVFPQYCADMVNILATLGERTVSWVGSSLGGLIGLVLAGHPGSPITRLVVNDVGPQVPLSASMRIGGVLNRLRFEFRSFDEAERSFRTAFAAYGPLGDDRWQHITRHSIAWDEARGQFVLLFDPKILPVFQLFLYYQMTLWSYWESFKGPTLCIRGAQSDFVTPDIVRDMRRRKPDLVSLDVEEVGHMPMLMSAAETDVVAGFLRGR